MAPNSPKHLICLTGSLTHLSYQFRFKKTTTVESRAIVFCVIVLVTFSAFKNIISWLSRASSHIQLDSLGISRKLPCQYVSRCNHLNIERQWIYKDSIQQQWEFDDVKMIRRTMKLPEDMTRKDFRYVQQGLLCPIRHLCLKTYLLNALSYVISR